MKHAASIHLLLLLFALDFSAYANVGCPRALTGSDGKYSQKTYESLLKGIINIYLPKAQQNKRRFGVELEFAGLSKQTTARLLQKYFGGKFETKYSDFKIDAGRIVEREVEGFLPVHQILLEGKYEGGSVPIILSFQPRSKAFSARFGNEPLDLNLKKPTSLAKFRELARSLAGSVLKNRSHLVLKNSSLGNIAIKSEVIESGVAGTEIVIGPIEYTKEVSARLLKLVDRLERKGAKGTSDNLIVGLHVSTEAMGKRTDYKLAPFLNRFFMTWHLMRDVIAGYFEPSPIRIADYNGRPYYGNFSKKYIEALKGTKKITPQTLLELFKANYDYDPAKHLDINPFDVLTGRLDRLEARLFNMSFSRLPNGTIDPKNILTPIEFMLAFTEWTATVKEKK